MTANRPGGRNSSGSVPPTSRRSARQQRLANREASRALARASTHGSGGSSRSLVLYSAVAVVIGLVIIGVAFFLTNQPKSAVALNSPNPPPPSVLTPPSIQTSGLTLGNPDAKATIDVYSDFQCPGCWSFAHDIEPQVVTNYVATGKAKLIYHNVVVVDGLVGGTESLDAANAALCAADQGKFWPYHDWLFANQYLEGSGGFTKDRLKAIAHAMGGLDNAKFDSCVDGGSHNSEVQAGKLPAGTNSTPTIAVNGTVVLDGTGRQAYDYASVSAAIDSALGVSPSPSVSASPSPTATPVPSAVATPSASPSV